MRIISNVPLAALAAFQGLGITPELIERLPRTGI